MKKVLSLLLFAFILISLVGCYTVPRHFADENEETIVYYPAPTEPPVYDPPILLPAPPVYYPPVNEPNPSKVRQPVNPKNNQGSSYGNRDPLNGGSNRGSEEVKTLPPVRNPERKDRTQQ